MQCGKCKLWHKDIPGGWDCAFIQHKGLPYGFCTAVDDVMFVDEYCIATDKQQTEAVPLE